MGKTNVEIIKEVKAWAAEDAAKKKLLRDEWKKQSDEVVFEKAKAYLKGIGGLALLLVFIIIYDGGDNIQELIWGYFAVVGIATAALAIESCVRQWWKSRSRGQN